MDKGKISRSAYRNFVWWVTTS